MHHGASQHPAITVGRSHPRTSNGQLVPGAYTKAVGATLAACACALASCSGGSGGSSTAPAADAGIRGAAGADAGKTSPGSSPDGGVYDGGDTGEDPGDSSGSAAQDGAAASGEGGSSIGTLDTLVFATTGDTRPPSIDDTTGYPTAIITQIFAGMGSVSPRPAFAVASGDYMYATPGLGHAAPQLDLYLHARGSMQVFPAMGNHECNGVPWSNCGQGNPDGVTENYSAFLTAMMQPLGQSSPYYTLEVDSSHGQWTAKFLFVAANAWNAAQASWFETAMAKTTTYTFIIRHEPASTLPAPAGVTGSEQIMAKYPYTLCLVGHTHTYEKSGAREVLFGNGGAPLSGTGNYGFGLLQQRADGAIQVDAIDYQSLQPDTSFRFAVHPDGSPAP